MIRLIFWNTCKQVDSSAIANVCAKHGVDLLMLAEAAVDDMVLADGISKTQGGLVKVLSPPNARLRMYCFLEDVTVTQIFGGGGDALVGYSVAVTGCLPITVCILHGVSSLGRRDGSTDMLLLRAADEVRLVERDRGHSRTVVVGDFNSNPYAVGLCAVEGFNALMTRNDVLRLPSRRTGSRHHETFYNPCWRFFGDEHERPSGTYYYAADPASHLWNVLDQVLLRPRLCEALTECDILSGGLGIDLMTDNGLPNRTNYSDHLPLRFVLNLESHGRIINS